MPPLFLLLPGVSPDPLHKLLRGVAGFSIAEVQIGAETPGLCFKVFYIWGLQVIEIHIYICIHVYIYIYTRVNIKIYISRFRYNRPPFHFNRPLRILEVLWWLGLGAHGSRSVFKGSNGDPSSLPEEAGKRWGFPNGKSFKGFSRDAVPVSSLFVWNSHGINW